LVLARVERIIWRAFILGFPHGMRQEARERRYSATAQSSSFQSTWRIVFVGHASLSHAGTAAPFWQERSRTSRRGRETPSGQFRYFARRCSNLDDDRHGQLVRAAISQSQGVEWRSL